MKETQDMQVRSLGGTDPLGSKWQPNPVFLPQRSHRQRSLAGTVHGGHKGVEHD